MMTAFLLAAALLPAGNAIVCEDAAKRVYEADRKADADWLACATPEAVRARQRTVRAALVKSLGGFPERTPLNPRVTGRVERDGYAVEKVLFESRPGFGSRRRKSARSSPAAGRKVGRPCRRRASKNARSRKSAHGRGTAGGTKA